MAASFYAQDVVHIEAVTPRGLGNPVILTVTDRHGEQVMIYLFVDRGERADEIAALFTAIYGDPVDTENKGE